MQADARMSTMIDAAPYSVPKEPGRWRALALAAAMHAALFALLWFGVRWQNETPVAVEAEVWSPQAQEAAPRPQPQPEPAPVKQPEPKPVPPAPVPPPPKPQPVEKPVEKPDIALEQEKKKRQLEEQAREREEKLAQERARSQAEEKARAEKLAQEKAARLAEEKRQAEIAKAEAAKKQAEKEKAEKAEAARRLAQAEAQKKAEALKKAEAEKKRRQEAADAEMLAKAREEEMKRITGGVTGTGGTGSAAKSQGSRADSSYTQRVGAKIKSNTIYDVPEDLGGNPAVEYQVELLPDGSLRGTPKKLKSSGIAGFDAAVLRAIEKSQPYPPDKSGSVPSGFIVSHRPKD